MAPSVLITGPRAILYAIREILQTHLAARVATIETNMGLAPGKIKIPNNTTGYSLSRKIKQEQGPCIKIYLDTNALDDRTRFPGTGSAFATTFVRVKIRSFSEIDSDSDMQVDVLAEAAGWVLTKYYVAWWNDIRAWKFEVRRDFQGASIRERGQTEGFTDYGRSYPTTDEEVDLLCEVKHRQGYAISYSKDLPPPPP